MPTATVTVPTATDPTAHPALSPASPVALLGAAVVPLPAEEPELSLRARPGKDGA
ncbi:hypothetical protein [Streptomyces sp. NPDC007172]|uniref:hypothetical protein n=1 Tax=Streptomyces sp. NPDC007172 TaxID=3364776 RepID=UPI00369271DA